MVLGGAAAAAAAAGGTLFDYNRKNFMYDRKQRQETEYQIMDFRIKQAELWREDVRDIIGLTSVKMDTYLIVNAVQLGFCVMAFCEGRLAAGTPVWLIGCHTLSLAGSFMYLLMSVWLAMHASVTAKSYEVRLLTQLVRLPVPSWSQLEGARTYSSGFEKVEAQQMFRVPFAMGTQESLLEASGPEEHPGASFAQAEDAAPEEPGSGGTATAPPEEEDIEAASSSGPRTGDVWGFEGRGDNIVELDGRMRADPRNQRHLRLVRHAMQYWQSYDGFARVALSCGTNQLVTALAYYVIGYVLISNHAVIACWLVVILFMVIAAALIRLDMSLTGLEYRISVVLVTSGPCLIAVAAEQWSRHTPVGYEVAHLLSPISYVVHAMWLMFLLYISNVREQKGGALLPTGFRSVMYIDVFGWIKKGVKPKRHYLWDPAHPSPPPAADSSARASGKGPAVQSLRYDQGQPVPTRPETLPGASQAPQSLEALRREDLEPTTFVPREKEGSEFPNLTLQAHMRPGFVPWRIFCVATVLLILLWWISGVIMLLMSCGLDWFRVEALPRELEEAHSHAAFLQLSPRGHPLLTGAQEIATSWHAEVQPESLACSDSGGVPTLAASGRFGWYAGRLQGTSAQFDAAPACLALEGEELQDLALSCDARDGCRALLLLPGGGGLTPRIASCPLGQEQANATEPRVATLSLSDGEVPEVPSSLALAGACQGPSCAFLETSNRRILEVRKGKEARGAEPDWFPTRTLADVSSTDAMTHQYSDKLHPVGAYLGLLQQPQQTLKIVDPRNGTIVGQWRLPSDQHFGTMCSMNDHLYFLTKGQVPKLWQFPVPEAVRSRRKAPAAPAAPVAAAQPASPPQKQWRSTGQVSLLADG